MVEEELSKKCFILICFFEEPIAKFSIFITDFGILICNFFLFLFKISYDIGLGSNEYIFFKFKFLPKEYIVSPL